MDEITLPCPSCGEPMFVRFIVCASCFAPVEFSPEFLAAVKECANTGDDATLRASLIRIAKAHHEAGVALRSSVQLPVPLEAPDFTALVETVKGAVFDMWGDGWHEDNDDKTYVYEAAVEAVFGKDVWNKINARIP